MIPFGIYVNRGTNSEFLTFLDKYQMEQFKMYGRLATQSDKVNVV